MKLVTVEQAARHLRLDDLDDPGILADLEDKVEMVSHMVVDYLKYPAEVVVPWFNEDGDPVLVPKLIQLATLVWLGYMEQHRSGEEGDRLELGEIPRSVSNILWRVREPAYA